MPLSIVEEEDGRIAVSSPYHPKPAKPEPKRII